MGDENGVIKTAELHEQIDIAEDGFGAIRTKGKSLQESEIGFFKQALVIGFGFRPVRRTRGLAQAPGIDAGNRTAQFGERLLSIVISNKSAAASEPFEIPAQIGLLNPIHNILDRRAVIDDITDKTLFGVLFPELVVSLEDILRHVRQRLPVDLHDDPERRQMRVHPIEGEALLDEEFVLGVGIENNFGKQAVDGHDGDLAGDRNSATLHMHIFSRFDLLGLIGELGVMLHPLLGVIHVNLETILRVLFGRAINLAVRIDSTDALGNFIGVRGFEEQAIEANARVALRIFFDEIGQVIVDMRLFESFRVIEAANLGKFRYFASQLLLSAAQPV